MSTSLLLFADAAPGAAAGFARYRGFLGIAVILGLLLLVSERRRAISLRVVFWGLGLQWAIAFLVFSPRGIHVVESVANFIKGVLDSALAGASFLFGANLVDPAGPAGFVFAFRVLPTVIFVAALFAILYYLGIMQWVVRGFAFVMTKLMGASGAESVNVAASLFLGQTEAPLTIRPYLPRLTRSELLTVMTSGMAHVSGGVMGAYFSVMKNDPHAPSHILTAVLMTAPGTILISKMLIPETENPETRGKLHVHDEPLDANLLDAASRGTREGLGLALNIAAMLIAFIGLVALVNTGLGLLGRGIESAFDVAPDYHLRDLSLQLILGKLLAPVAWILGVPGEDCTKIGGLLGTRTILNEMIAFGDLGKLVDMQALSPKSVTIATFALCGFANLSSIGIQLGGIGALVPERRADLARLGLRALLAGTLANLMSACIAGILL